MLFCFYSLIDANFHILVLINSAFEKITIRGWVTICNLEIIHPYFYFSSQIDKCVVDYTEKGWFITYIDRNPEAIKRQEALLAKERMDATDDERTAKFIQKQIERVGENGANKEVEYTELQRDNEEEKVTFSLSTLMKTEPILKTSTYVVISFSILVYPSFLDVASHLTVRCHFLFFHYCGRLDVCSGMACSFFHIIFLCLLLSV